jgi:protease I
MPRFTDLHVAVLATDGFEEVELTQPLLALRDEGAWVEVVSPSPGPIQGYQHDTPGATVAVDRLLSGSRADQFDALVLPGGRRNAAALRDNDRAKAFVRAFQEAGKPIAAICHAPWILISAGLVRGRTLTGYSKIQPDIDAAGGNVRDEPVVTDDNWVTSRQPSDLPQFVPAMFTLFERSPVPAHH